MMDELAKNGVSRPNAHKVKHRRKIALITGASSGMGEAIARLLARKIAHVALGVRRKNCLEPLAARIAAQGRVAQDPLSGRGRP
jgi:NADP-dependent 3-hydroxy acid dehydrogenase YdfG